MTLSFRKRLQKGDVLIGSLLQMPLPEIAESFVEAGYDWLFIDLEHSPMDARTYLEQGYRVIGLCTDYIMMARTAAEYLKAVR